MWASAGAAPWAGVYLSVSPIWNVGQVMQGIEPAPLPGQNAPILSTASRRLHPWRDPGNAVPMRGSAETHFTLVPRQENPKDSLGIFHL